MSYWGQLTTIVARYMSIPMIEYSKNMSRLMYSEGRTSSRLILMYRNIGHRVYRLNKHIDRWVYRRERYERKYRDQEGEYEMISRGIDALYDGMFYSIIFVLGYYLLYTTDKIDSRYKAEIEEYTSHIYDKMDRCNSMIDSMHDSHANNDRCIEKVLEGIEGLYNDIDSYVVLSESFKYRCDIIEDRYSSIYSSILYDIECIPYDRSDV